MAKKSHSMYMLQGKKEGKWKRICSVGAEHLDDLVYKGVEVEQDTQASNLQCMVDLAGIMNQVGSEYEVVRVVEFRLDVTATVLDIGAYSA